MKIIGMIFTHVIRFLNIGSKHTLVISHVKSEDFGKYACKATNNLGSQQKVIELTGMR